MSPNAKKLWTEALKSKKYQKGRKSLRAGDCFCAIGVLCDVLRPDDWMTHHQSHYLPKGDKPHVMYTHSHNIVAFEAQLPPDAVRTIIKMNDKENKSFEEIAEWIENNL